MPRKPGKKAYRRKRKYIKRRRSKAITYLGGQFPNIAKVTMKHVQRSSYDITSGAFQADVWSLNSAYDPYYGTGGKGCAGWTQWATMYNRYRCSGSSIKVSLINVGSNPSVGSIAVALYPSCEASAMTNLDDCMAQKYSKYAFIQSLGSSQRTLRSSISVDKLGGLRKGTSMIDDQYTATVATDPAIQFYWILGFEPVDRSSNTTIQFYVEITYNVEFFDINTPAQAQF